VPKNKPASSTALALLLKLQRFIELVSKIEVHRAEAVAISGDPPSAAIVLLFCYGFITDQLHDQLATFSHQATDVNNTAFRPGRAGSRYARESSARNKSPAIGSADYGLRGLRPGAQYGIRTAILIKIVGDARIELRCCEAALFEEYANSYQALSASHLMPALTSIGVHDATLRCFYVTG
jgi:hypothetical protein